MVQKTLEKEKAVILRRRGLSYREILRDVPVAKSTLSLWLRSVGLSKRQKQRLTEKNLAAIKRGWAKIRAMRLERIEKAKTEARQSMKSLIRNPLWLSGVVLYWAEGSKMKSWRRGERISFSNMDPSMISLFRRWLSECLVVLPRDICYDIYIHKSSEHHISEVKRYWANLLKISPNDFRLYFKKHNLNPSRKNINSTYYGLLRMVVKRSSALNHKVTAWIEELPKSIAGW